MHAAYASRRGESSASSSKAGRERRKEQNRTVGGECYSFRWRPPGVLRTGERTPSYVSMSSTSTTLTPSFLQANQHSVLWSVPPSWELAMERGDGKGDKEKRTHRLVFLVPPPDDRMTMLLSSPSASISPSVRSP